MLLLKIDRTSSEPVYHQIARQVVELVQSGALKVGDRLPSTRALAGELGVSRFTVAQAYDWLWSSGYTEGHQGSCTTIRARPKPAKRSGQISTERPPRMRWSRAVETLRARYDRAQHPPAHSKECIDFSPLTIDPRLFPLSDLRRQFAWVLRDSHAALFNYADAAGYLPLRQFIASRMQRHGVDIEPDEVLITHGSLQGLALIGRLLVNPGQAVAIEQPTYPAAASLLTLSGARILGVPMLPEGMDLDALERLLSTRHAQRRPALVYSIPTYHNPTGITTQQPHRERLLSLCTKHGVPLVEDGFQEEITYFGRVVSPIKSMDHRGMVFYLGSFSKVFVPGLRIGWIAAHKSAITQLTRIKQAEDISCSPFVQAALSRFCTTGAYELHLRRMNRVYSRRLEQALAAIEKHLSWAQVRFVPPTGGYLMWFQLEGLRINEARLLAVLGEQRVAAAPASWFYVGSTKTLGFRLSISSLNAQEIETGISRLGKAIARLCS